MTYSRIFAWWRTGFAILTLTFVASFFLTVHWFDEAALSAGAAIFTLMLLVLDIDKAVTHAQVAADPERQWAEAFDLPL